MKNNPILHTNIEKSAFRKGEYVGYCFGAQRIRKGGQGWETYSLGSSAGHFVYATAPTLHALGIKLEKIKETSQPSEVTFNGITKITGHAPNGGGFTLRPYSLEWHAHDSVGSIGVPLKADAPLQAIADEITSNGRVSEETCALWFNC